MNRIEARVHGIPMITAWYAESNLKENGIIIYRQAKFQPKGIHTLFDTLVTDLTESEEEIIGRISKSGRYEIRRAEKEGVRAEMKCGKELTGTEIRSFCEFFEEFWRSKGVDYREKEALNREISAYAAQGNFVITKAGIAGQVCVYHTYILCGDTVRLYHSASLYRTDDSIPKKIVGMSNRYLHKEDMLYFKKMGIKTYDWGGAGKGEEVKNITEFKESFGGTPAQYYDFTQVNGWQAKLVSFLADCKRKLQKGK